jgi:TonB family protein
MLEMVVGSDGVPSKVTVQVPAGHGFDESAVRTISQWRFAPGMKDGKPVAIRAHTEVSFALPGFRLDKKEEEQRSAYTRALSQLMGPDRQLRLKALESMAELSKKKYPPAMMAEGNYLMSGEFGPRDTEKGRALVAKSAEMGFAPAIYLRGWMLVEAIGVERDIPSGLKLIIEAADMGNLEAQHYLADASANGRHGEKRPDDAIRYFRLCAAQGRPACQYQLARLLLSRPDDGGINLTWAIAWLKVASANGDDAAHKLLGEEMPKLTPAQLRGVENLRLNTRLPRMQATGLSLNPKLR